MWFWCTLRVAHYLWRVTWPHDTLCASTSTVAVYRLVVTRASELGRVGRGTCDTFASALLGRLTLRGDAADSRYSTSRTFRARSHLRTGLDNGGTGLEPLLLRAAPPPAPRSVAVAHGLLGVPTAKE